MPDQFLGRFGTVFDPGEPDLTSWFGDYSGAAKKSTKKGKAEPALSRRKNTRFWLPILKAISVTLLSITSGPTTIIFVHLHNQR